MLRLKADLPVLLLLLFLQAAAIIGVGYVEGPYAHTTAIALLCVSLAGGGIALSG